MIYETGQVMCLVNEHSDKQREKRRRAEDRQRAEAEEARKTAERDKRAAICGYSVCLLLSGIFTAAVLFSIYHLMWTSLLIGVVCDTAALGLARRFWRQSLRKEKQDV